LLYFHNSSRYLYLNIVFIMSNIIDKILSEVCVDDRIPDGIFDLSNDVHMCVLRENLMDNYGLSLEEVTEIHNKMLEGKYPERQAYNKDGLLVTFPTPQHKQRAIQRGTHFEYNPTKGPPNVFDKSAEQPQQPQQPKPQVQPQPQQPQQQPPEQVKTPQPNKNTEEPSSLPQSDARNGGVPTVPQPTPQIPPTSPVSGQQVAASDAQNLKVEPSTNQLPQQPQQPQQPTQPAPPPNFETPKSGDQKQAEAQVVKQIMQTDDTHPSLPYLNERKYLELSKILSFSRQMGYREAEKVISNAMIFK